MCIIHPKLIMQHKIQYFSVKVDRYLFRSCMADSIPLLVLNATRYIKHVFPSSMLHIYILVYLKRTSIYHALQICAMEICLSRCLLLLDGISCLYRQQPTLLYCIMFVRENIRDKFVSNHNNSIAYFLSSILHGVTRQI